MNTTFLLMARYNALPVIPADVVCRDFFAPLSLPKFMVKVGNGEIKLPLVRMEASQKGARGVALSDLAAFIDARCAAARKEAESLQS